MSELVGLDNLALTAEGPTLSMSVSNGALVGIYGPAGSGKTDFLRVLNGEMKPPQGKVNVRCGVSMADSPHTLRRIRPLTLARSARSPEANSLATEALLATHLWEAKGRLLTRLTRGQQAAAQLLTPFTSNAEVVLIDHQLDYLDPWALKSVLTHLRKLRSKGKSIFLASNKLDLLPYLDMVVVLENRTVRFAGDCEDLLRRTSGCEFQVTSNHQPGARALVAPFAISVEEGKEELRFRAHEGQEIAARLLLEGYGNITMVVQRQPTLEEALLSLIR